MYMHTLYSTALLYLSSFVPHLVSSDSIYEFYMTCFIIHMSLAPNYFPPLAVANSTFSYAALNITHFLYIFVIGVTERVGKDKGRGHRLGQSFSKNKAYPSDCDRFEGLNQSKSSLQPGQYSPVYGCVKTNQSQRPN